MENKNCLNCNSPTVASSGGHSKGLYCNSKCQHEYSKKQRVSLVLENNNLKAGWSQVRAGKQWLIEYRGHKCEICHGTVWMNQPIPLVLDHIDGDSENWSLDNLRLICGNCDMQTPTYKSKNKGKGRYSRAQRYKAGKSY